MNSLAANFERKFLFSVGRHFWNFTAVCGFTSMLTGGVIALNSQLISSEDRNLLNETIRDIQDFESWMSSHCYSQSPKDNYSKTKHDWACSNYSFLMREDTQQKMLSNGWDRFCGNRTPDGKTLKQNKFVNGACTGYEWFPYQIIEYTDKFRDTHSTLLERTNDRKSRQAQLQLEMSTKLGLGGIVSVWGLGTVAVASLYSALLSIERNTRKQES